MVWSKRKNWESKTNTFFYGLTFLCGLKPAKERQIRFLWSNFYLTVLKLGKQDKHVFYGLIFFSSLMRSSLGKNDNLDSLQF